MAGSGKKRTTMAKLTRENRLRERRLDKRAKKDARKLLGAGEGDDLGGQPQGLVVGDERAAVVDLDEPGVGQGVA
jgi:hypothetical protein